MTEPQAKPPRLGVILDRDRPEPRDAIHIAVISVLADQRLAPGEHVAVEKIGDDYRAARSFTGSGMAVGVIDPFLTAPVFQGDRCWLFLYPGSITTLRHQWTHRAFAPEVVVASEADQRAAAQRYLEAFAGRFNMMYSEMIDNAVTGSGLTARNGTDVHSWGEAADDGGAEFWRSLEIVTGKRFDADHREETYFGCSC